MSKRAVLFMIPVLALGACGGGDSSSVDVPDGATFCSVFNGEYAAALALRARAGSDGFGEVMAEKVAWAEVLAELAPEEIAAEARDNVGYHQAHAEMRSAAEHIPGSNAMHAWGHQNC